MLLHLPSLHDKIHTSLYWLLEEYKLELSEETFSHAFLSQLYT
jgi:hypothetical protein